MKDVSGWIMRSLERDDRRAAESLFPLVYDELRSLAAARLRHEVPGQTLQPTALVHEAYLRLVKQGRAWDSCGHFFIAAAEAMRRILVEQARRKKCRRRGGGSQRLELAGLEFVAEAPSEDLLALDEALTKFETQDAERARLIKLRYFAGMTIEEAAAVMGISRTTATRFWTFGRAWLYREIHGGDED